MELKVKSLKMKAIIQTGCALCISTLLAACGDGSDGGGNGSLSLGITDGPVDDALQVLVQFDGVEIQPADGERITFTFATPQTIDLLALQGDSSEMLLMNETVPAGDYNWIRLMVNAEQDMVFDSYIVAGDGTQHELWIPSGAQTGLQLNSGFSVAVGSLSDFTIDFDLRKSVTNPPGLSGYILKPSLRLIDNQLAGTLSGSIDPNLIAAACDNPTENDGAIYLYVGSPETADDIQGAETDPLTTALVAADWRYEIGFLAEGEYSAAFTCDNDLDDPEADDELEFFDLTTLSITANSTTQVDFVAE